MLPFIDVGPVLVTVDDARTPKVLVDPNTAGNWEACNRRTPKTKQMEIVPSFVKIAPLFQSTLD
jgi:hypothetical protein